MHHRNMSLSENSVSLVGNAAPQFGSATAGKNDGHASLARGAPGMTNTGGTPWLELDFLRFPPPPPPPPEPEKDEEDIDGIVVKDEVLDLEESGHAHQVPEEVLVLDEVGVCEDESANSGVTGCAIWDPADSHNSSNTEAKLEAPGSLANGEEVTPVSLTPGLDDDILSIMCDDNEDDVLGGDASRKRDWNSESRFGGKRKQDSPSHTPSRPTDVKRCRSMVKTPPESNGRSRSGSVHSRLGRPKCYQHEYQRPCFKFTKNGICFRPSCPFLHPNSTIKDNGIVHNHFAGVGSGDNIMPSHSPHQLFELQQKVQEQQAELRQQKQQQQVLMQHLQQTEMRMKQYAANQAKQVFNQMQESLHHQHQQQQDQFDQTKEMYEEVGRSRGKTEDHVRVLESLCRVLQLVLEHNLQNFAPDQADRVHNGPTSRKGCANNASAPPRPPLPDLRQIPPLKKPDVCRPPRPRSADFENQRCPTQDVWPPLHANPKGSSAPQRPRSADNQHCPSHLACFAHSPRQAEVPFRQHHNLSPNVGDGRHGWYLGPAFHGPPLVRDARVPGDPPFFHVASNPRVVRILPVRHCANSAFDAYQHERVRVPVQPQ